MTDRAGTTMPRAPFSIRLIAIVNGIGFILVVLFWGLVWVERLVPQPWTMTPGPERVNAATTYGFLIGDLIWSAALLLISMIGLRRLRFWGWAAAQAVNVLWIYSMTVIVIRDLFGTMSPGTILFTPFAIFSFWACARLWKVRHLFSL